MVRREEGGGGGEGGREGGGKEEEREGGDEEGEVRENVINIHVFPAGEVRGYIQV